jgi:hypothetical protein
MSQQLTAMDRVDFPRKQRDAGTSPFALAAAGLFAGKIARRVSSVAFLTSASG